MLQKKDPITWLADEIERQRQIASKTISATDPVWHDITRLLIQVEEIEFPSTEKRRAVLSVVVSLAHTLSTKGQPSLMTRADIIAASLSEMNRNVARVYAEST